MKTPEHNKVHSWNFKNTDDVLDKPETPRVITCPARHRNGDTCITLPSKLNGDKYHKYGVVKPVPLFETIL